MFVPIHRTAQQFNVLVVVFSTLCWITLSHGETIEAQTLSSGATEDDGLIPSNGGSGTFDPTATLLSSFSSPPFEPSSSTLKLYIVAAASITPPSSANSGAASRSSPTPSAAVNSSSSSDPDARARVSTPVAMIAGVLAGSIVIIAAILVVCVVSRRKNGKNRTRRASILGNLDAQIDAHSNDLNHSDDVEQGETLRRHRSSTGSISDSDRYRPPRRSNGREHGNSGTKYPPRRSAFDNNKITIDPEELNLRNPKLPSPTHVQPQTKRSSTSPRRSLLPSSTAPSSSYPLSTSLTSNDINHIRLPRSDPHSSPPPNSLFPLPLPTSAPTPKPKAEQEDLPPAYDDFR